FAGKFRLIDFPLSNCVNSGLRRIYVLTQYLSESLNRHIQEGWAISGAGLGDYVYCIPAQQKISAEWYSGTADAVRQNLNLIKLQDFDEVLILSSDQIYKMDYRRLVACHRAKKAELTISAIRETREKAAGKLGVLEIDPDYRIIGFEEKPAQPKTLVGAPGYVLASMGIYLFSIDSLFRALQGEEDDFGKHIIPEMISKRHDIFVYDYEAENKVADFEHKVKDGIRERVLVDQVHDSSYWKDVGTIEFYYEASMGLLSVEPLFNLYGDRWPYRTHQHPLPPSKCILGGKISDSIMCDGCIISGGVVGNSILSPGVIVESNAVVEQSIIFDNVIIEPDARIKRAIIDKETIVGAGASIGYDPEEDKRRGCTISDNGIVVVPKGMLIQRD
ncbi:MAG: glucose-1-phosphate adenylyltransferase, partial [Dehalococcoidales bacterium]|nr:glucose-1-phosphate adenylyltransferase [Dehalococcoidales bacterium]